MLSPQAIQSVLKYLAQFAAKDNFEETIESIFGSEIDRVQLVKFRQQWLDGDWSVIPPIEIVPSAEINGANGSFAIATNKIYISQELIANHQGDEGAISEAILEEVGHFVNWQLNQADFPGDEGTIFSALVRGELLNLSQLDSLKTQDNSSTVLESIMPSSSELLGGYSDPLLDGIFISLSDTSTEASPAPNPNPLSDAVEISSDKNIIGIGGNHQVTYTFKVTNKTEIDATNASVKITIPKGIKIIGSSVPESIVTRQVDSEGNTIITVGTGSIFKNSTISGTLTVEATGFSQPLENLQDYLWDVKITSSASGTFFNVEYTSNTAVVSTQVDSSKGLAEKIADDFLLGSSLSKGIITSIQELNNKQDDLFTDLKSLARGNIFDSFSQQVTDISNLRSGLEMSNSLIFSDYAEKFDILSQSIFFGDDAQKNVDSEPLKILNEASNKPTLQDAINLVESTVTEKIVEFAEPVASNNIFNGAVESVKEKSKALRDDLANGANNVKTIIETSASNNLKISTGTPDSSRVLNLDLNIGSNISSAVLEAAGKGDSQPLKQAISQPDYGLNIDFVQKLDRSSVGGAFNYKNQNGKETTELSLGGTKEITDDLSVGLSTKQSFGSEGRSSKYNADLNFSTDVVSKAAEIVFGFLGINPNSLLLASSLDKSLAIFTPFSSSFTSDIFNYSLAANNQSFRPVFSESSQFVVITSAATNLIGSDTNNVQDVFFVDLQGNTVERASVANDGTESNGKSEGFAIDTDGNYIVFASNASNLVANDSNSARDIFIRDRIANTTKRVSLANDNSQANGVSDLAAISANGRYVVFSSIASLVEGDTNEMVDVFVRDLETETTELISTAVNNSQSNNDSLSPNAAISEDGRYVVFYSYASNLVANDTNDVADIFVRDRQLGTTKRISTGINGTEANEISLSPSISADSRYVVFSSLASNLVSADNNETGDIFVYDLAAETLDRVSLTSDEIELDGNSSSPSISADGRYVAFQSRAANLGVDNPDFYSNIYVRDRVTGETKLVSPVLNGKPDGDSRNPSISANGSIAFESGATNLVAGDTNNVSDIFVYKPVTLETNNAEIRGLKWNDINGNGLKDTTESGLRDWKIYLDTNTNGQLDTGEASTTTDIDGNYSFTNLRPGTYTVAEQMQPGWKQTYPGVSVTTTSSDIQLINPSSPIVTSDTYTITAATSLINLNQLWADARFSNIKGKGYSTVIIDTGADLNSSYFGADADNNGIADKIVYQYDFADNDTDASDKNNHGSHIASIASTVAPDANLIVLKVFKDSGTGSFADLEKALQWVNTNSASYNIASVNLSLGDGQNWNTPISRYGIGDELAAIASQNVLINAAAGNGFYTYNSALGLAYPAIDPSVISVGAVWTDNFGSRSFSNGAVDNTTAPDRIASFSQRSPLLDVFAPGILITGANATGGTISMGGTSQSTAYLSGIATLAQQIAQTNLGRKLTLTEFDTLLDTTSDLIIDGDDENDNVTNTGATYPRINVLSLAEGILSLNGSGTNTTPSNPTNGGTQEPLKLPVTNLNLAHTLTLAAGDIKTNINFGNQKVNQLPTLTNISKTGTENTNITFSSSDFTSAFSDADSNSLTKIQIAALPTSGSFKLDGIGVTLNQEIAVGELNKLLFTPNLNFGGKVSFGWNGFDGSDYAATNAIANLDIKPLPRIGDANPNTLNGTDGDDTIDGGAGNDTLNGGEGDDIIIGSVGVDLLFGGNGKNIFVFNKPTEGIDKINDFVVGDDRIGISRAGFGGASVFGSDSLVGGALDPSRFTLGTSATTASQRFIYNDRSGALFFDTDGVGGTAQVRIAQLVGNPNLTNASFVVI
jgi:uncharacterized repeat protein (TIGR01451 family)